MNLSMLDELELFSKELQRYMSPDALEHLAREIGFVQRKSKYFAQDLVAICVWLSENIANASLTQLCSVIKKMKPDRVYLVCKSLKNLHQIFRKKKKSHLKLNLYKLSLMEMLSCPL